MRLELPSGTPVELALPEGEPTRGVVVIPDIGGLRPLFDDLAARLAAERRWAVAAFEPFPGRTLTTMDERFDAVATLADERLLGDAADAADLLRARTGTDRVAVMGFCMGAMFVYKAAAAGRFDKAVPFYGMIRIPPVWRGPALAEPLELLADPGTCPVLAIVGDRDPYTPPDDVSALARVGPWVTVIRYADAEHGFVHDPERPAHRPGDAADAWGRVYEFLT